VSRKSKVLLGALFVASLVLATAKGVLGAEEAHSTFEWKKEALKTLNLLIVLGVLWWALKDRLPRFFAERRSSIDKAIEEARAAKAEAEAKRAEYEAKLAQIENDIAGIDAEAARRVEAMRAELAEAADAAAERIAAESTDRIAEEVDRARAELQREAALLAVELAEELIKDRVGDEDHQRLVEATVKKLEGLS
jgi:F-type H+-transporting ATPase subunit b